MDILLATGLLAVGGAGVWRAISFSHKLGEEHRLSCLMPLGLLLCVLGVAVLLVHFGVVTWGEQL